MKQLLPFFFAAALLAACAKPTLESQLAAARGHVASGEYQSAVVEYKNALSQQPRNAQLRVELSEVYLKLGLFDEAEKELDKALERGAEVDSLIGPLAQAIYYQDDYIRLVNRLDELVGDITKLDNKSALFRYIAAIKGQLSARDSIALPSEQLSGDYLLIAKAFEALANENPEATLNISKEFASPEVEAFEKHMIVAIAHAMLGNLEDSILEYESALSIYQTYYPLRFLLAERLISARRIDEAETQIQALIDINPASAYANYLNSITLLYQGKFEEALQAANLATQGGVNLAKAHFIAGVSAYQTDRIESAHRSLVAAVAGLPRQHIAHKLLAKVRLELGYIDELAGSLESFDIDKDISSEIYALAAVKSYKTYDNATAEKYLEKSLSLSPNNPVSLLRKGLIQFERGEDAAATLNRVISLDPTLSEAWTLKALNELEENGIDAAIAVANEFKKTQELAGFMLEGLLYLEVEQDEDARDAFKVAHDLDPTNSNIGYYYMVASARTEESLVASQLAEKLVNEVPNSLEILLDKVNLLISQGKNPMGYLDERIAAHPELPAPVAAKAYLLMNSNEAEKAISLLKSSNTRPHYSTFMALGEALLDTGRLAEASSVYKNWTDAFPSDYRGWYRYIITAQYLQEYSEALAAVEDALAYFPRNPKLVLLQAHFYVALGENARAATILKSLNEEVINLPEFDQISGTVAYNQGDYVAALALLKNAYIGKPSFTTAELLAHAHAKNGDVQAGISVLKNELKKVPDTYVPRHLTASYASNYGFLDEAIEQYEILMKEKPNDFVVLNNYANVLVRVDEIDRASQLASQALEMQPQSAYALSTFGLVKLKQGEIESAQRYFERALLKEPNNTEMLLHLAEALIAKNEKLEAETLLGKIIPKTPYERRLQNSLRDRLK